MAHPGYANGVIVHALDRRTLTLIPPPGTAFLRPGSAISFWT